MCITKDLGEQPHTQRAAWLGGKLSLRAVLLRHPVTNLRYQTEEIDIRVFR